MSRKLFVSVNGIVNNRKLEYSILKYILIIVYFNRSKFSK